MSLPPNPLQARRDYRSTLVAGWVVAVCVGAIVVGSLASRPAGEPSPTPTVTVTAPPATVTLPAPPPRTVYVERPSRAYIPRPPVPSPLRRIGSVPTTGEAQRYARGLVSAAQWRCLRELWTRESGWRWNLSGPDPDGNGIRAYGIPQALPGSKMRSAGADWRTNPRTQIRWGLRYIANRYGTPCAALAHHDRRGWY